MRVLLVDDSATMRRIQKMQLNSLGVADVVEASDGQDALVKLTESWPVDMVLLDWNMPNMDGLTCLKHIRQKEMYKAMKVVMCTSESEKSRVMEALQAGANNYVVKPFTPEVLREKIGM
jgi:two-component system chemotaxis response regulator CheY